MLFVIIVKYLIKKNHYFTTNIYQQIYNLIAFNCKRRVLTEFDFEFAPALPHRGADGKAMVTSGKGVY